MFRFRYGAYLSKEQVAELVRPHPDTLELVGSWLVHHGIRSSSVSRTHGGAWLTVTNVLISQANQLLGASYQLYRNTKTNETIISAVGYSLPAVLHAHIKSVAPMTYVASVMRQTLRRRSFGAAPAQAQAASRKPLTVRSANPNRITPSFLRWMYRTAQYVPAATNRNKLVVLGNQYPSQEDLTRFTIDLDADSSGATFSVVQVNGGGYDPSNPGSDVNVGLQYAGALAHPTPLVFYGIVGPVGFIRFLNYLSSLSDLPPTISITYSAGFERNSPAYATTLCEGFAQFGVRGVSFLIGSGNNGVGAGNCRDGSGNVRFIVEFPASCTCAVSSPLSSTTQAQVQVAHQTAMVLQVPMSLPLAALQESTPCPRRASREAAFRPTFRARPTRILMM
jgi:tripeptidyl-peptidase-1